MAVNRRKKLFTSVGVVERETEGTGGGWSRVLNKRGKRGLVVSIIGSLGTVYVRLLG